MIFNIKKRNAPPSEILIPLRQCRHVIKRVQLILFIFLLTSLSACTEGSVAVSLSGLNYTDNYIVDFSVNGYSGANISANGGGGSFVCCVSIPRRWSKDLKVTIRWVDDDAHPERYKEKIVAVPEYTEGDFGSLVVHFYPNDVVKVLITTKTERYPGYPYPRPAKK